MYAGAMLPASALALERLLVRRRELTSALVYADAFEHWGPREGPEFERMTQEIATATREHADLANELERTVRQSDGAVVRAWAEAHIDLLQRAASATADEDVQRAAQRHIEAWTKVARGELAYVDESSAPVQIDAARYAGYFGDSPSP